MDSLINPVSLNEVKKALFPLKHDCILKVEYYPDCGMREQYFSCQMCHANIAKVIISQLFCVRKVKYISVEKLCI